MASRTQRTKQRNATRKKNRDARRDALHAVLGIPFHPPGVPRVPYRNTLLAAFGISQPQAEAMFHMPIPEVLDCGDVWPYKIRLLPEQK